MSAARQVVGPVHIQASQQERTEDNSPAKFYQTTLPPSFLPFPEFKRDFALSNTSTEQLNSITSRLSQVMAGSIENGMKLLLSADQKFIDGFDEFIPQIGPLAAQLAERFKQGGRVFLVGSGTSGRISIDLAAKCNALFPESADQVHGIISGGDSVIIRAKEKYEDSEKDGDEVLKEFHLKANDTVILISASGSASFNVGCGHYAANEGAQVLYFYNSKDVPARTEKLFTRGNNPVKPLCVDIGPQAIAGSTRLQVATLAEACLGSLLISAFYQTKDEKELADQIPLTISKNIKSGMEILQKELGSLAEFAQIEKEIFSNPESNFRELQDKWNQGYVTILVKEDSAREVLIDATELPPTYSVNGMSREGEVNRKRAEFYPYLVGVKDNQEAWKVLLGREVNPQDRNDVQGFLFAKTAEGTNSYANRPIGIGNFSMAVIKLNEGELVPDDLMDPLIKAKNQDGITGLVLLCRGKLDPEYVNKMRGLHHTVFALENIPHDPAGISETILLKQVLNLISNASMVLMNKVHGNQMIDVNASNQKLIGRCLRITRDIWEELQPSVKIDDEVLYHYISHVSVLKKNRESTGMYTPSVVKIVLAMLALEKTPADFEKVVQQLLECQESIHWIVSYCHGGYS